MAPQLTHSLPSEKSSNISTGWETTQRISSLLRPRNLTSENLETTEIMAFPGKEWKTGHLGLPCYSSLCPDPGEPVPRPVLGSGHLTAGLTDTAELSLVLRMGRGAAETSSTWASLRCFRAGGLTPC